MLSPTAARKITSSAPENWCAFESPVSDGPQGAREGSVTILLAGPEPTDAEASLLADESDTSSTWTPTASPRP